MAAVVFCLIFHVPARLDPHERRLARLTAGE
jgi:hypothetical protein